jgi:serine/threonine-protein kinase HipA
MFPQFKHMLAMAIGDEFEPTSINAYQLADFAETCGVNKKLLSRQLSDLADNVIAILTQQPFIETITQETHFTEDDRHYMAEVQAHILARTQHLKSQAPDIPSIEV